MSFWPETCAVCRDELPERGNRRVPIPWLGGRRRLVHARCVGEVEAQATLDVGGGRGDRARGTHAAPADRAA